MLSGALTKRSTTMLDFLSFGTRKRVETVHHLLCRMLATSKKAIPRSVSGRLSTRCSGRCNAWWPDHQRFKWTTVEYAVLLLRPPRAHCSLLMRTRASTHLWLQRRRWPAFVFLMQHTRILLIQTTAAVSGSYSARNTG